MRKQFCSWLEEQSVRNPKLVLLTGDLGYNALEKTQKILNSRFINVGVCEQNMISVAAGMAHDGWEPICYSISPFAVFRPAEQIRLDVCIHGKNVKIIGNGGGYGYGIMGATHHSLEDIALLSSLKGMRCLVPRSDEDVSGACDSMMSVKGPAYLRLNSGSEAQLLSRQDFSSIRSEDIGSGPFDLVIFALGPMVLHVVKALKVQGQKAKVFSVSELPLFELRKDMVDAIRDAKAIWVFEEHVARGGLGEHLCWHAARAGLQLKNFQHVYALGYPNGLYGNQNYHQEQSGLSVDALVSRVREYQK